MLETLKLRMPSKVLHKWFSKKKRLQHKCNEFKHPVENVAQAERLTEIKLMTEKQTIKRKLLRVECPKWSENELVLLVISKNQLTKIEWNPRKQK